MSTDFPLPGKLVGFPTGAGIPAPLETFFPPSVEGEKSDLVPPLHVGVQERLGRPDPWQAPAASVTNRVDNSVLVQSLRRLIFVNFSISVF